MASRFLGRYAPLLCRASFQAPAAAATTAAAARLRSATVPEPQPGQFWLAYRGKSTAPKSPQGSGKAVCLEVDEPVAAVEQQEEVLVEAKMLDKVLTTAKTPEEVLAAWAVHKGHVNQATMALALWAHLVLSSNGSFKDRMSDPRLQDIMKTIRGQVGLMWNNNLVKSLRTLRQMDLKEPDMVLGSVQTEVLWRIRKLSFSQLAQVARWGADRKGRLNEAMVTGAIKQMELRWTEISDVKTIIVLLSRGQHLSPTLIDRVEDKVLEFAESFTVEDISKTCASLAGLGRRSVPVLRALSYHLLQKSSSELTPKLILDIIFAYGKLKFRSPQVLQRFSQELVTKVPQFSPIKVTRFAKSVAFLKWLNFLLFEAFAEHYINNSQNYSTAELCSLLMSFARVNFIPSKGEDFFSKVHLALEHSLSGLHPVLQTDTVWSLCVLQQAKQQQLLSLMQKEHIAALLKDSSSLAKVNHLKLRQIAATLHLEHPASSESAKNVLSIAPPPSPGKTHPTPLQNNLLSLLQILVGSSEENLRTNVDTVYGWTIDAEMVVDGDMKPIDLTKLKAPHLPGGGGDQVLPPGAHRFAFVCWEFPNYGTKNKDLLGRFTMMKRHLQLAGFILVEIPYYEMTGLNTEWQKLSYLKDKMGKAVAEEMAR